VGALVNVYCILTEGFLTLTEVFPCFFLSCKANARVKLAKTRHGPHSSKLVVICVVGLLFVLLGCYLCCSMYCLCVNVYCHLVTTQMQLINIISYSNNAQLATCFGCSEPSSDQFLVHRHGAFNEGAHYGIQYCLQTIFILKFKLKIY